MSRRRRWGCTPPGWQDTPTPAVPPPQYEWSPELLAFFEAVAAEAPARAREAAARAQEAAAARDAASPPPWDLPTPATGAAKP